MKILIVDDSKAMRTLIKRSLKKAGYQQCEVTEAANGKEALTAIADTSFDLILSDWNMPEMSGGELQSELRAREISTDIGFVSSNRSIKAGALKDGARFVIAKPFQLDELKYELDRIFQKDFALTDAISPQNYDGVTTTLRVPRLEGIKTAFNNLFPKESTIIGCEAPPKKNKSKFKSKSKSKFKSRSRFKSKKKKEEKITTNVIATCIQDDGTIKAGCITDLKTACTMGAALSLIPATAVQDAVAKENLPEGIMQNIHEVFNVIAALFATGPHSVNLETIYIPPQTPPAEISEQLKQAKSSLTIELTLDGYDPGNLTFLVL